MQYMIKKAQWQEQFGSRNGMQTICIFCTFPTRGLNDMMNTAYGNTSHQEEVGLCVKMYMIPSYANMINTMLHQLLNYRMTFCLFTVCFTTQSENGTFINTT